MHLYKGLLRKVIVPVDSIFRPPSSFLDKVGMMIMVKVAKPTHNVLKEPFMANLHRTVLTFPTQVTPCLPKSIAIMAVTTLQEVITLPTTPHTLLVNLTRLKMGPLTTTASNPTSTPVMCNPPHPAKNPPIDATIPTTSKSLPEAVSKTLQTAFPNSVATKTAVAICNTNSTQT